MSRKHSTAKWWTLAGVSMTVGAVALDFAIINTALPIIQTDLHATTRELQWMMNVITLAMCALIPVMGRLGDVYGRRLIFYIGTLLFILGSLFAGLSGSALELIGFRALQGIGIAMIFPCSLAIVTSTFSEAERSKAISIWSGVLGVSVAIGPALGGFIVSLASWRWVFFSLILMPLIGFVICFFNTNEYKSSEKDLSMDYWGSAILLTSMSLLLIGIIEGPSWHWVSSITLTFIILGVVGLYLFYLIEQHSRSPIIHFGVIKHKLFLGGSIAGFSIGFVGWPTFFLLPLYLYYIQHYAPYQIGLALLTISALVSITSPVVGLFLNKIGFKLPIMFGLILYLVVCSMLIFFNTTTTLTYILITFAIYGVAWGLIYSAGPSASMSMISKDHVGMASGAIITIRNFGSALGLSIAVSLFRSQQKLHAFVSAFQQAMILLLIVSALITMVVAWFLYTKQTVRQPY